MGGAAGPPSEPTPSRKRITVVYVVGNPRSGSTVFGVVLGHHPNAFFTGELNQVPVPAWVPGRFCACHAPAKDCVFWSGVKRDVESSFDTALLRKGQLRFERWARLFASLTTSKRDPALRAHIAKMAQLARLISEHSGKEIVVDSSKSPARGRLYQYAKEEGIDVAYIHVIRDGRGFLWSEGQLPGGRANAVHKWRHMPPILVVRWALVNLLSTLLCGGRRRRYLLIRYEDFVADPEKTMIRVGKFLHIDMTSVIQALREHEPIPVGHVVGGSRLRFGTSVRLKPDTTWQQALQPGERLLFWALGGWAAWAYGYHTGLGDSKNEVSRRPISGGVD